MFKRRFSAPIITFLIACLVVSIASAQKSGTITYLRKTNIHKLLPPEQQMLKAMIPEFKEDLVTLSFTSNYAKISEKPTGKKSGNVMIQTGGGDNTSYINRADNTAIELITIDGKTYGTVSEREKDIKLTKEKKVINGYTCYKAIGKTQIQSQASSNQTDAAKTTTDQTIVFWYCKDLPKGLSPMGPKNIPGCVLEIESDAITYTLKTVEKKSVAEKDVAPPTGWKKISHEQMMDLMEEQIEEMEIH